MPLASAFVRGTALATAAMVATGCASASRTDTASPLGRLAAAPTPDPRVGLKAGLFDAGQAVWNLRVVSTTPPPKEFVGHTNSDLAFTGPYAIQGNYNGFQVWDLTNPASPQLVTSYVCPASQSDVSVYRNLLFVSGEGLGGRVDCGVQGVPTAVSKDRLRGIRIFDITDIRNPKYLANVQTCRGSHTHSVLEDPNDKENVYIYVSGSAGVRPDAELPGCSSASPADDPNTALFRIEVIRVPLADPTKAAIVSSPRIFNDLVAPPRHGLAPADKEEVEKAKAAGKFVVTIEAIGETMVLPDEFAQQMLDQTVKRRGGSGRQRRRAPDAARDDRADDGRKRRADGPPPRPDAVPRHHAVSGDRARRRRVRGLRPPPRHPQPGEPGAARGGRRLELLVLALGHVQQRRGEGALHRRMGRRRRAEVPRERPQGVGRQRHLHRARREDDLPVLLQAAGGADAAGELRRAQRVADPDPRARRDGAGVVPGRHLGLRLDRSAAARRDRLP
jgi:hypothetical protein